MSLPEVSIFQCWRMSSIMISHLNQKSLYIVLVVQQELASVDGVTVLYKIPMLHIFWICNYFSGRESFLAVQVAGHPIMLRMLLSAHSFGINWKAPRNGSRNYLATMMI